MASVSLKVLQALYSDAHQKEWAEAYNKRKQAEQAAAEELHSLFNLCKDAASKGIGFIRVKPEDVSTTAKRLLAEAEFICDTISFKDGTYLQISGWAINPCF